jgi:Tfp pilus assembly protein PilF
MRYTIIAVLVLATLAGVSSYGYVQAYSALQVVKGENTTLAQSLKAEQARTARIQQTVQTLESQNATTRRSLREALKSSPTWSSTPVPTAVAGSLCNAPRVRCTARPVPTP